MPRPQPEFVPVSSAAPAAAPALMTSSPGTLAWTLGLAGLIPFLLAASFQWFTPPGWRMLAASALLGYGAVIASFLGGIHWGLAMRTGTPPAARLIWGVMPSLLGWLAVLLEGPWGQLLLALSLLACWLVDRSVYRDLGLAAWLPLRTLLSAVAIASVLLGALAYWIA